MHGVHEEGESENVSHDTNPSDALKYIKHAPFDSKTSVSTTSWPGPRKLKGSNKTRMHKGVDFGMTNGSAVYSAGSGTVKRSSLQTKQDDDNNGIGYGYGNVIEIDHGGGYSTVYGHMSIMSIRKGDLVESGNEIGKSGGVKGGQGSGNSRGPHLHFEIRENGKQITNKSTLIKIFNAMEKPSGN